MSKFFTPPTAEQPRSEDARCAERSRRRLRTLAAEHGWTVVRDLATFGRYQRTSRSSIEWTPAARFTAEKDVPAGRARLSVRWDKGRLECVALSLADSRSLALSDRFQTALDVLADPDAGFVSAGVDR